MKKFRDIINEAKSNNTQVTDVDFVAYTNNLKGSIPVGMVIAMNKLSEYGINDANKVNELLKANKSQLTNLSNTYKVSADDLDELQKVLKANKNYLNILPMFHSKVAIKAVQNGVLKADDLLIDLTTSKGRNDVAKKYMPVVYKIVNQMSGKSRLSHSDLLSAALEIFTKKMMTWKVDGDDNGKVVSFKTYIAYVVRFGLSNEMGKTGHTLSGTSSSAWQKHGAAALDAISLDNMGRNSDGELKQDYLAALGVEDEMDPDEKTTWSELYKEIESKFSQRDSDIFYSFFGLNDHKKEKNKDISTHYGVTRGAISQTITKIITWLKKNPKSVRILRDLSELYNESLMIQLWRMDREEIMEQLINDDVYLLLESVSPWKTKSAFLNAYRTALTKTKKPSDIEELIDGSYVDLDDNIKTNREDIVAFLSSLYPTSNINNMSDIGMIDKMHDIQKYYKQYGK